MKISNIVYTLSGLLLILSASFILPLAFSCYYKDELQFTYAIQVAGMALLSLILRSFIRRPTELTVREGFLIVTLSWIFLSFFGAIPFMVSGFIPNLTDAFFETMSGFTTTGASILINIEALPKSLLLWRDMTHWLGGMGVIVLAVAIFPFLGTGAIQLFRAEVPGPIKDKISPRISETAKILWSIYFIFTIAETALLMVGGVSFFESLCTTFGTMGTGGFSPRNASIAAYSSAYVHYVIIFFMLLAGTNFSLHYWALKGKLGYYFNNPEFCLFLMVIGIALGMIFVARLAAGAIFSEELFRGSLFQIVSIISTTGFITENFEKWPLVTRIILLSLMFIGACTASTGGAIKNVRILILFKEIGSELKKLFHPHGIFPIRIRGNPVPEKIVANVMVFIALYILIFFFGVLAIAWLGMDLHTSIGSVAATLGNVGPGIGTVGPVDNYSHIPILGKWILSFLMMIGRLEIFTVLVIFTRHFWD